MEDIDLGMRLSASGTRIEFDMQRWSVWRMVRTDFSQRGIPWSFYVCSTRSAGLAKQWAEAIGQRFPPLNRLASSPL